MFVQSKVRLKYILITCDLFWGRIPLPSLQGRDLAGIYLPRGRSGMHARGDFVERKLHPEKDSKKIFDYLFRLDCIS